MSKIMYKEKQLYYEEFGSGPLVLLLHGNTASGHMFDELRELYKDYHLVIPDFIGHGRSERLASFPIDFWYDQGLQIHALMKQFPKEEVILIGSSGGAIAALNALLIDPTFIRCIVADSFLGETCEEAMLDAVKEERAQNLESEETSMFYYYMQGEDYRKIVEMDTDMLLTHARNIKSYFHAPLDTIHKPVLLIGSCEDELIRNMQDVYQEIETRNPYIKSHMFQNGGHPAMLSNAIDCASIIHDFISSIQMK